MSIGVVLFVLGISVVTDLRSRRIYNIVTLPAILLGLVAVLANHSIHSRWGALVMYVGALSLSFMFCLMMERGKVWAAGDSKLFLAVTVWINGFSPPFLGISLLIGLTVFVHLAIILIQRLYGWWKMPRCWWIVVVPNLPLGRVWQYPGSINIAIASGVTIVFNEMLASGRWMG